MVSCENPNDLQHKIAESEVLNRRMMPLNSAENWVEQ